MRADRDDSHAGRFDQPANRRRRPRHTALHDPALGAISVDPWHSRCSRSIMPTIASSTSTPAPVQPSSSRRSCAAGKGSDGQPRSAWSAEDVGLERTAHLSASAGGHPERGSDAGCSDRRHYALATDHPKAATIERSVKARSVLQVYVDYLQNIIGKTVAAAYAAGPILMRWSRLRSTGTS